MTKFDLLDMNNYRIEKLPKRDKSKFEKWLAIIGPILAIAAFILFAFIIKLPFLETINSSDLVSESAKKLLIKLVQPHLSEPMNLCLQSLLLQLFFG